MRVRRGTEWETRDGAEGLAPRRYATVIDVVPGKHNLDKGPTHRPPDDDVVFTLEGVDTVCGFIAFVRAYVPRRPAD